MSSLESNVIEFDFRASRKAYARKSRALKERPAKAAASSSTNAQNGRLRLERREVWRMAEAATRYWRARLDFHGVLQNVQEWGMPEGRNHPTVKWDDRDPLLNNWRAAFVRQLLTPAPDANSVKWKQIALAGGQHRYTDVKEERIDRAIADDLAWLDAHPTKRSSSSEARARRREFNEAMRRRVKEIAASRDLSDEEIRPALKLKHEAIARFCEAHGVNLEWLLEGTGRIFKSGAPQ